ncbi:MAG: hypothetical protein GEV08_00390 [Acidimicrobiia bacterium]|nr:hypothetical protein [Acidimicrobiia bacterium]
MHRAERGARAAGSGMHRAERGARAAGSGMHRVERGARAAADTARGAMTSGRGRRSIGVRRGAQPSRRRSQHGPASAC